MRNIDDESEVKIQVDNFGYLETILTKWKLK